jgi:hypothetical protein
MQWFIYEKKRKCLSERKNENKKEIFNEKLEDTDHATSIGT